MPGFPAFDPRAVLSRLSYPVSAAKAADNAHQAIQERSRQRTLVDQDLDRVLSRHAPTAEPRSEELPEPLSQVS